MTNKSSKVSLFKILEKLASGSASSAPTPLNTVLDSAASTSETLAQIEKFADQLDIIIEE